MSLITGEAFSELRGKSPHRIVLGDPEFGGWKMKRFENRAKYGVIDFNFTETVKYIFTAETGLRLVSNSRFNACAVCRYIGSEDEYEKIERWIVGQGDAIFIRSLLSLCLALDFQMRTGDGKIAGRTETGELVYQAKPKKGQSAWLEENRRAIGVLVNLLSAKIQNTAGYQSAAYIAAVPPSPDKPLDLPTELAKRIAEKTNLHDIGAGFSYASDKLMLKEVSADKKWVELEKSGMAFDRNKGGATNRQKGVILLDDLYQSGATMHYAAMQMQRTGMSRILGLTAVKTMRNDDNQQRDN